MWANGKQIKENPWGSFFLFSVWNGNIYIYRYTKDIYIGIDIYRYRYSHKIHIYAAVSIYIYGKRNSWKMATSVCLLQTENRSSKLPFVFCKQKTEAANLRLFSANGKRKFGFLNRCMINGNRNCCFSKRAHPCQKHISYLYVKFGETQTVR